MLAIEVELLTGRYAATAHNDRRRAEWPPHPARFFSALVAALHDRELVDDSERKALSWLECQEAPALDVDLSVTESVGKRAVHDVWVPVNDVSIIADGTWARLWNTADELSELQRNLALLGAQSGIEETPREIRNTTKAIAEAERKLGQIVAKARAVDNGASLEAALFLLPQSRTRQVRTFPVVIPTRPTFTFVWPADPTPELRASLGRLCLRVTRLGHSSSLVRCAVVDRDVSTNLVPAVDGDHVLRVIGPGQLDRLESAYDWHQEVESRVLPARPQRYARPSRSPRQNAAEGVFTNEWILFQRVGGARPVASRTTDLTAALRGALLEVNGSRALSEILTGHRDDGSLSDAPHIAFVACPFIGHPHADGSVQGCAIVIPRGLSTTDRTTLLKLVMLWEKQRGEGSGSERRILELGSETLPPVRVVRVDIADKWSLRPSTWCRPAKRFVTATPIALDRHPGKLRSNYEHAAHKAALEAQLTIADSCERIGLPRPVSVEISLAPLLQGAQHVREFLPWPGKPGRTARARVHADILFDRPMHGPLLLGAGRYFGLGLCLPIRDAQGGMS